MFLVLDQTLKFQDSSKASNKIMFRYVNIFHAIMFVLRVNKHEYQNML